MIWYKLGTTRDFTLAEARAAAKQKFAEVQTGRDPMAEKRTERNVVRDAESFAAVSEKFIDYAKEQTGPRTAHEYQRQLRDRTLSRPGATGRPPTLSART
jgi:Arm DNA-binding domain